MAKRSSKADRTSQSSPALESQVEAFAEQLGYIAGSIEARAEGFVGRKKLSQQLTTVRDGAKRLLDQLASGVTERVGRKPAPAPAPRARKTRSGGAVDAPGKKHRKPAPAGPAAAASRARNTRVRAATPTAKIIDHRARQG